MKKRTVLANHLTLPPTLLRDQRFHGRLQIPKEAADDSHQKPVLSLPISTSSLLLSLFSAIKNTGNDFLTLGVLFMIHLSGCIDFGGPHYLAKLCAQGHAYCAYGKFKSVSGVIGTICAFPLLGCGREMNLQIGRGLPWRFARLR